MWRGQCLAILLLLSALALARISPASALKPDDLRCDFRLEPLGIDTAHPRLSWALRGSADQRNQRQSAYRILVSSSLVRLDRGIGDLWDSGTVYRSDQSNIAYAGAPLKSGQICYWKVKVWDEKGKSLWSRPTRWEVGILHPSDWLGAWINDGKASVSSEMGFYLDDPAPLFRKEFAVHGPILRARLYVTGLGYYEARLNGSRVGDHVLDPGWTDFDKRVSYSVYDVTRNLATGKNCLGVMVGNGWYNPLPIRLFGTFNLRDQLTVARPRLIAQLRIEYRDGFSETIASDRTWKVSDGPIRRNNIYLGEVYDAREEQSGWDEAGFDDAQWRTPVLANEKVGPLVAQPQPPIRVTSQWSSVMMSEPKPGVYVYDCGVNFAGWARIKLNVARGTVVRMRYGELLHADGTLNPMTSVAGQIKGFKRGTQESIGGPGAPEIAWQTDTYIARGGGETFSPRFTFHGFRYVEVIGLSEPIPTSSVTAMRLNSDVETVGSFECSNPLLNKIQAICQRTFLSNIFSVQSDCPHRERLAYGGDIVATCEAFMANFDMAGFYEKTVRDWSDSALPDGMFTDTAPYIGIQYCGLIWAMAHPLLVEQLYQYYGNRRLGAEEYAAARRWMGLLEDKYPDGIVYEGLSDHEGLAPAPAAEMVSPLYFHCARILAKLAARLGHNADATYFDQLASKIQAVYNERFVDVTTGKVGPGTQASQSIALYTGIAPEQARAKIFDFLVKDIEMHKGKITTGILGTKYMLEVLSREGRSDLTYKIVTQPEFPGWVWMLKNGATTLWEHWEYSENTFSHNHPMFGSVSQWMMQWLGGIRPDADANGYDRIAIQPQTPTGLDWVHSSYKSNRGKIVSNWSRKGSIINFEIIIPPNTLARVCFSAKSRAEVTENGKPLSRPSRQTPRTIETTVGSGSYTFSVSQ